MVVYVQLILCIAFCECDIYPYDWEILWQVHRILETSLTGWAFLTKISLLYLVAIRWYFFLIFLFHQYQPGFIGPRSTFTLILLPDLVLQGRAHPERSGFDGPWTLEPLKFDNSYFV